MIFGESLNCWGVEHMKKEQSRMTGEGVVCREESIEDLEDNIEDDLIIDLGLDLGPVYGSEDWNGWVSFTCVRENVLPCSL